MLRPPGSVAKKRLATLACFALPLLSACGPQDEVRSYRVKRTSDTTGRPGTVTEFAERLDHMLVAVFPRERDAVFFKLTAPAVAVGRLKESFTEFARSVDPGESGQPPTWQLPEGWEEQAASGMRLATLTLPDEEGPVECTVTALPMSGGWDDYLESNITRWMGQLSLIGPNLPPTDRETLLGFAKPIGDADAVMVELRGVLRPSAMPRPDAPRPGAADNQPSQGSAGSDIRFTKPEAWQPGRMTPSRKAAFSIPGEGGTSAEVTVTAFPAPAGSPMADVEANVARWRGQLGKVADAVDPQTNPLSVSGSEGTLVELIGPEDRPTAPAMVVAMVPKGGQMWFVKLSGPRELVADQRELFTAFLESVELP